MNGCDTRIKYPQSFLNPDIDNLWKLFKRKHLSLNLFLPRGYYDLDMGVLPRDTEKDSVLFDDDNLNRFVNSVEIKDNSVTFIVLHDYHAIIDDIHANPNRMDKCYEIVGGEIDLIFDKFNRDMFDIVVIFSDHGCLLGGDIGGFPHRGRIQTYLQLWIKNAGIDNITRNNKLCSCMDLFPTMASLLGDLVLNRIDGVNLMRDLHSYLVIEDYLHFTVTLEQVLGWWGVIFPDELLITDCSGNWYVNGAQVQLHPEQREMFETILKNYASQYAENTKGQRILNKYYGFWDKKKKEAPNDLGLYSNGEKRVADVV